MARYAAASALQTAIRDWQAQAESPQLTAPAVRAWPARTPGYQVYDYHLAGTRATWVIADVGGHGVSAAQVLGERLR